MTGNAPSHLWAWETITALFWSTLLHILLSCSALIWKDRNKGFVYDNTVFAGLLVLDWIGVAIAGLLALGWIGVAIGMIYEQHVIRPRGFWFYDRCSIAAIPLCIIEG